MNNKEHYNNFINAVYANFDKYTKYSEYYREPTIKTEKLKTLSGWREVIMLRKINIIEEKLQPTLMFDVNGITKDGANKFATLLCTGNVFRDMERAIHVTMNNDFEAKFNMYYVRENCPEKVSVKVAKTEANFLFTIDNSIDNNLDGFQIMKVHKNELVEKLIPELEILARMNKAFLNFKDGDAEVVLPYIIPDGITTLSQEAIDPDSCIISGETEYGNWRITADRLIIEANGNQLEFSNDIRVIDELITAIGPMFIPMADLLKSISSSGECNLTDIISNRVINIDKARFVRESAGDIALNVTSVTVDNTTIKGIYGNRKNQIDYNVLAILALARKELNNKLEDMFKVYLKNI